MENFKKIKDYYKLILPKYVNSTNPFFRLLNGITIMNYRFINKFCDKYVREKYPVCNKKLNIEYRKEKIIVSLTTIPSRIYTIPFVLKSIFNQSMMPDEIILWITDRMNSNEKNTVLNLLKTEISNGLEVSFVTDIKVHTKYFYAIKRNPDNLIITIDDDMIYPEDLIENLYKTHLEHPDCVIAGRAHEITCKSGYINLYNDWNRLAPGVSNESKSLLATGVGGVLYPPECLYDDWEKIELFLELCPTADDIWLKIMESKRGTKVCKLHKYTKEVFTLSNTQTEALIKANVGEGRNDILLRKCQNYYGFGTELFCD